MREEKKFWSLTCILIILILLLSIVIKRDKDNYVINQDGKKFNISHKDNYVKILVDDIPYLFEVNDDLKINYIYYFSNDSYVCILPVNEENKKLEFQCYDGNIYTEYHNITTKNSELDEYAKTIDGYDITRYNDDTSKINTVDGINFYVNNKVDKNITITTYGGLINNGKAISIFKNDVYNNELSAFVNNYYFIADYENKYTFNSIYIVNLDSNQVDKIKIKFDISLDSYIQGIVDDIIYLYDKDNEKQYKISVEDKSIEEIVSEDKVKYYKNNKWTYISKAKANKVLLFDYNDLSNDFTDYDYVVKTDKYFYLLKKNNKKYDVYKVNINELDIIKYVFSTPTTNIICSDDFVYYVNKNNLYYYSDTTGLKTILYYNELDFNDTIKINIY